MIVGLCGRRAIANGVCDQIEVKFPAVVLLVPDDLAVDADFEYTTVTRFQADSFKILPIFFEQAPLSFDSVVEQATGYTVLDLDVRRYAPGLRHPAA